MTGILGIMLIFFHFLSDNEMYHKNTGFMASRKSNALFAAYRPPSRFPDNGTDGEMDVTSNDTQVIDPLNKVSYNLQYISYCTNENTCWSKART